MNGEAAALIVCDDAVDIVHTEQDEPWSRFVCRMLAERTERKAHALVLLREVLADRCVAVDVMPRKGAPIAFRISTEGWS